MPNYSKIYTTLFETKSLDDIWQKIQIIEGDCGILNLGISPVDRALLCENVTFMFHFAAHTSFNATYKRAVEVNLRGAHEMMKLAADCRNLQFFCHLSTAMCNLSGQSLKEESYSPSMDPYMAIGIAELFSEDSVEKVLSQIQSLENVCSYTFTKQLTESLIAEAHEKLQLPMVICRPVLVTQTYKNPVSGWINRSNFLVRIAKACLYGMLKTLKFHQSQRFPVIPADYVINDIMICTWNSMSIASPHLEVINFDSYEEEMGVIFEKFRLLMVYQFSLGLMVKSTVPKCMKNAFLYWLDVIFRQWIPAVFLDFFLICMGQKPM